MIVSEDNWIYTNKEYGFNLKVPKKHWSDPRILISSGEDNEYSATVVLYIPSYNKRLINERIPDTSTIPKRYEEAIIYYIYSVDEYQKEIQNEDNGRGVYDVSGIEILKDNTKGHNNKYYFVVLSMYQRLHEDWKSMVPALECEEDGEGGFYCEGLRNMFPKGMISFFDI